MRDFVVSEETVAEVEQAEAASGRVRRSDVERAQREIIEESRYGGTMRLGGYAAVLRKESRVLDLYDPARREADVCGGFSPK